MSRTASNAEVPGWYIEFQANVLRQLPRPGEIDQTEAMGWNQNQKALKKVLAYALLPDIFKMTYKVTVDYSKSLTEMISVGQYDCANHNINDKNFKIEGKGMQEVELVLVHLNLSVTNKEALELLNQNGFEPAKIEHLLAFGVAYPELQREFPIVALGSVGGDGHPSLDCIGGGRGLEFAWNDYDGYWHGSWRFLAVRKVV